MHLEVVRPAEEERTLGLKLLATPSARSTSMHVDLIEVWNGD